MFLLASLACTGPESDTPATNTPLPEPEQLEGCVTGVTTAGDELDLSDVFGLGTAETPAQVVLDPSVAELHFCAGTWYVEITTSADLALVGMYDADATSLSGGGSVRVLTLGEATASTIQGVTLRDGLAELGGAVFVGRDATLRLDRSVLTENDADDGGALYLDRGGVLDVVESRFESNRATKYGGALMVVHETTLTVLDSEFIRNEAESFGGAVNSWAEAMTFERTAFVENLSEYAGGAISGEAVDVSDCLFEGNSAWDNGGALYLDDGTSTIGDSAFVANTADEGAAIYVSTVDRVILHSSAVTDNEARKGAIYAYGPIDGSHVDFSGNTDADVTTLDGGDYDFGDDATFHCDRYGC